MTGCENWVRTENRRYLIEEKSPQRLRNTEKNNKYLGASVSLWLKISDNEY
jgi:hypothetical protein